MTEGVCIMATMREDRGELDLTKRVEELEKSLSIALEINDKSQREGKDKDLLAVKIKEVEELTKDNKLLAKQIDDVLNIRGARSVS